MIFKLGLIFALSLQFVFGASFLQEKVSTLEHGGTIDTFAFENEIRDFLEKIRGILKNGDPENNVPPMEPLPLDFFDFDFILRESRLKGYLDQMLVHNISDFVVRHVRFAIIGIQLELGLSWDSLTIDGKYQAHGNIFDEIAEGEGAFQSQTNGLDLDLILHIGSNFNRTIVKELNLDFKFGSDHITFTNILEDGSTQEFGNEFLQKLLYRIRDDYFPLLLNTLTLVGSDLVHDYTIDELLGIILGIIQGQWLELIRLEPLS